MNSRLMKALSILMVVVVLGVAGCGGGGKNKKTSKGGAEGVISGKVNYFTGFDMFPAETPAGKKSGEKIVARLYRVQPDGSGLAPVSEAQPAPADSGSFRVQKAPVGELNMVLRLENDKSEPVMSAIVPPPTVAGVNLTISPESTLEAELFAAFMKEGFKSAGDLRPEEMDAAFIKDFIISDMFFSGNMEQDQAKLAAALLPFVKHAYGRFAEGIAGNGATPGSATVINMARDLSGAEMALAEAAEKGEKIPENVTNEFEATLKKKAADNGIINEMMSPDAAWKAARALAFKMEVKCMSVESIPGCPVPVKDAAPLSGYAALLEADISERSEIENLGARLGTLFEGSASGSQKMPPVDSVQKMAALPGAMVEAFRSEGLKLKKDLESEDSREKAIVLLGNLRDSFADAAMGMDREAVAQMMSTLTASAQPLIGTLANPGAPASQLGKSHRQFMNGMDIPLGMIMSAARARYTKFEESDLKKLSWAMMRVVLLTSLPEIPYYLLDGRDTDGDGYSDNTERMLGTEATDGGSVPGVVLSAMPGSMLPTPTPDSDSDGWPDSVEKLAGSNPDDRTSTPQPGIMKTCDGTQAWCAAPAEQADAPSQKYQITGSALFEKREMQGLTVGAYREPVFEGKKPEYSSEAATDERGGFSIAVKKPGKYFIAAFRDMDGSGSAGRGEAVGYHGSPYPAYVEVGSGSSAPKADVEMIGIAGTSRCQSGQYFEPATGKCVTECGVGMKKDELTLECRCADGAMFAETTGKCDEKCPAGTVEDPIKGGCYCPEGSKADANLGQCVCVNPGMRFSEMKGACMCESGYLIKSGMRCEAECPAFLVPDDILGECVCPQGMKLDASGLKCVCEEGFIDPSGQTCVSECAPAYVKGPDGLRCECPKDEMYNGELKKCDCVPGMERSAQGKCAAPVAPKPTPGQPKTPAPKVEETIPSAPAPAPAGDVATGTVELEKPEDATTTISVEKVAVESETPASVTEPVEQGQ